MNDFGDIVKKQIDVSLEGFENFYPQIPYETFWNNLLQRFQNGNGANGSDLKKAIYGFANSSEYRMKGVFGYTVPLNELTIFPGIIGVFNCTEEQNVAILAQSNDILRTSSARNFKYWVERHRKAPKKYQHKCDPEIAMTIINPYRPNGLVIARSIAEIQPLSLLDLKPTASYGFLCQFEDAGRQTTGDLMGCIELPCYLFAEHAFLFFDRRGGGALEKGCYTWGLSSKINNLVATLEYIQTPSSSFLSDLGLGSYNNRFYSRQCELDGMPVVNFMGMVD